MFEIAFDYRFEAAHRFTKSRAYKCATPHGHSWRARLELVSHSDQLNDAEMVVEFSQLKRRWKSLVTSTLDHSFFANHEDPILEALLEHIPELRLLRFPGDPTTELLASLLFAKANAFLRAEGQTDSVEVQAVHIRETETNSVRCRALPSWLADGSVGGYRGWWSDPDPESRLFERA